MRAHGEDALTLSSVTERAQTNLFARYLIINRTSRRELWQGAMYAYPGSRERTDNSLAPQIGSAMRKSLRHANARVDSWTPFGLHNDFHFEQFQMRSKRKSLKTNGGQGRFWKALHILNSNFRHLPKPQGFHSLLVPIVVLRRFDPFQLIELRTIRRVIEGGSF